MNPARRSRSTSSSEPAGKRLRAVVRPGRFDGFDAGLLAGLQQEPLDVDLRRLCLVALCGGRPSLVPVVVAAGRDAQKRQSAAPRTIP